MKKLFLIALISLAASNINAQVTWNVKVGGGMSFITGSNDRGEEKGKLVMKGGFGAEFPLGSNFILMPSVEYAQKGWKWEYTMSNDDKTEVTTTLHYVQVPVMMAYRVNMAKTNMTLKFGPYVAYCVNGKSKEKNYGTYEDTFEYDFFGENGDKAKRTDVGIIGGLDFELHRFVIGVEYEKGFRNILRYYNSDKKVTNSSLYMTLGYKF